MKALVAVGAYLLWLGIVSTAAVDTDTTPHVRGSFEATLFGSKIADGDNGVSPSRDDVIEEAILGLSEEHQRYLKSNPKCKSTTRP